MEERMAKLEKRVDKGFQEINQRFDNLETRLENAFETLIREVKITNNTLQSIFNITDEVLRIGSKHRKVSEIMSQAYEKAAEELKA